MAAELNPLVRLETIVERANVVVLLKITRASPGWVLAQLNKASFHTPKGCRFDPRSEHIPSLWVKVPKVVGQGA